MRMPPKFTKALRKMCDCITKSLESFHLHTVDAIYNEVTG